MMKLIVQLSYGTRVCDLTEGLVASEVASQFGITDPVLYQEFAESDFDPACFLYIGCFTLSAGVVGFDLAAAQEIETAQAKAKAASEQTALLNGYTVEVLTAQASLPVSDRSPEAQAVLDDLNAQAAELQTRLAAIAAASTAKELNTTLEAPQ
jgi:hypothetical protein